MRRSTPESAVSLSSPDSDERANPVLGRVLDGRYAISRVLGRGGMGVVYLAKQLDPELEVVIKMLSPSLRFDPQSVARFEGEAKRLQQFEHANIVRFYGYGYDSVDATSYLVMEYVDGEILKDVLQRKGKLAIDEFVPIAAQVLKAVGYVHSHNVFIRDIKPCNVMLCEQQGRANFVKLLDFGLAKATEGDQAITSGYVLGTAGYIAPEVLRGEKADFRADIYSLGVMFYLCLSGRLPFDTRDQAVLLRQTLDEEPPHLSTLIQDPAIPAGLIELIHQCLDKNPDRRPPDADALMEELIDVVPASLFRLPRSKQGPGHATFGSESHRFTPRVSSDSFVRGRSANEPMHPLSLDAAGGGESQSGIGPARPAARRAWPWMVAATVVLLGGVFASVRLLDREEPGRDVSNVPRAAAVAEESPAAIPPVAEVETDRSTMIANRFRDAERAAARGEPQTALEGYLDVLEMDPGHRLAQSGLERVREAMAKAEAAGSPSADIVVMEEPAAAVEEEERSSARARPRRARRSGPAPKASPPPPPPGPSAPEADARGSKSDADLILSPQGDKRDDLLPMN